MQISYHIHSVKLSARPKSNRTLNGKQHFASVSPKICHCNSKLSHELNFLNMKYFMVVVVVEIITRLN